MNRIVTPAFQGRITPGRGLAVSAGLRGSLVSRRGAEGGRVTLLSGVEPEQLQAGRGVQISGRDLVVSAAPPEAVQATREDTRLVRLWGKLKGTIGTDAFESPDWVSVAQISRLSGAPLTTDGVFWEATQLFQVMQGETLFERTYTLTLEARIHALALGPYFPELGEYESGLRDFGSQRGPYLLTLEETVRMIGRPVERVKLHEVTLPLRGAFTKKFQASQPGVFTELRPISIIRI